MATFTAVAVLPERTAHLGYRAWCPLLLAQELDVLHGTKHRLLQPVQVLVGVRGGTSDVQVDIGEGLELRVLNDPSGDGGEVGWCK